MSCGACDARVHDEPFSLWVEAGEERELVNLLLCATCFRGIGSAVADDEKDGRWLRRLIDRYLARPVAVPLAA